VKDKVPELEKLGASKGFCEPISKLALRVDPLEFNHIIMNQLV